MFGSPPGPTGFFYLNKWHLTVERVKDLANWAGARRTGGVRLVAGPPSLAFVTILSVRRPDAGLGRARWVVERTFAWLHHFERLLVRFDHRDEIHEAFLALGCCLVCFRRLRSSL